MGSCAQGLVRQAEIVDVDSSDSDEEGMGDSHTKAEGEEGGHHQGGSPGSARGQLQGCVLYTHGVRSCHFTLVLQARSTLHQLLERRLTSPNLLVTFAITAAHSDRLAMIKFSYAACKLCTAYLI